VDSTEEGSALQRQKCWRTTRSCVLNTTGDSSMTAQKRYLNDNPIRRRVRRHPFCQRHQYRWPWYAVSGAYFASHPESNREIRIANSIHRGQRACLLLGRTAECIFPQHRGGRFICGSRRVELFSGGTMSADHRLHWCQPNRSGPQLVHAMGHTAESYADRSFAAFVGWIESAPGLPPARGE